MIENLRSGLGPPGALTRPRFDPGDYLTAADLDAEQAWRRQRLRRHNRHLHGYGVVCGLWVAPAFDTAQPWGVSICPGYGIAPYGDEILISCRAVVDLRSWLWSRPATGGTIAYVAIRYREVPLAGVAVPDPGCGCSGAEAKDTRFGDCFRVDVLWNRPAAARAPFDLCRELPGCEPCPDTPYLVLAGVTLPSDEASPIADGDIDNALQPSDRLAPLSTFVDACMSAAHSKDTADRANLRSVAIGAHLI